MRTDDRDDHDDRDGLDATVRQALGPLVGEPWKVEDAKSRLTKLIRRCREGSVELIGVQGEPVLMISCRELANVAERLHGPQTWGELLERSAELRPIDSPLPMHFGTEAPPLDLDADLPDRSVA